MQKPFETPPRTSSPPGAPQSSLTRLCDVPVGEKAIIVELCFPDAAQQYLMRLGFVPGVEVEVIRRTPLQGPVVYRLQGTDIAIRYETAAGIGVHVISTQGAELP